MIRSSSTRGEIVFDPYGGSMSTAAAAMGTGRRWIMGELDEQHCQNGLKRLMELKEELLAEGFEAGLLDQPRLDVMPVSGPVEILPESESRSADQAELPVQDDPAGDLPELLRD